MQICVIGTGYVGLVVGTCFAETGNEVLCVDVDQKKLRLLRRGISPIYEPGLESLLKNNIAARRISFTSELKTAVRKADAIFLALPTPAGADGSADLKHILETARNIGKFISRYTVIVNKSTVPVGTAQKVRAIITGISDVEFDVVSNPEFLKEGAAVSDFMKPDRVVIGSRSPRAIGIMQELYAPFVRTGNPVIIMDESSAELTKYAANAFLATKISYMNEIANLCDLLGADVEMVRKGIGTDPRIGPQFLFAGAGYGGSCFPKDIKALARTASECRYDFKILKAVETVNHDQRMRIVAKIVRHFHNTIAKKIIAVWGLSFKPNTDDMREAPSVSIIRELLKRGAVVQAHDPVALPEARRHLGDSVRFYKDNYAALRKCDALLVLTEWNQFRRPDFDRMKSLMRGRVIFDGRNVYDPTMLAEKGFAYFGIGRGTHAGRI